MKEYVSKQLSCLQNCNASFGSSLPALLKYPPRSPLESPRFPYKLSILEVVAIIKSLQCL